MSDFERLEGEEQSYLMAVYQSDSRVQAIMAQAADEEAKRATAKKSPTKKHRR